VSGKLTKIVEFGIFVELEPELQGLLHRSEIPDTPPAELSQIMQLGQELRVRVLRVDAENRKIALSLKLDAQSTSEMVPNE
jgi:small subunit ribosomal protein S1